MGKKGIEKVEDFKQAKKVVVSFKNSYNPTQTRDYFKKRIESLQKRDKFKWVDVKKLKSTCLIFTATGKYLNYDTKVLCGGIGPASHGVAVAASEETIFPMIGFPANLGIVQARIIRVVK